MKNIINKVEEMIEKIVTIEDKIIDEKTGQFLSIETHDFKLKNGIILNRDIVVKQQLNSSMTIPKTEDGNYVLVIQPRPATKRTIWIEFPAGYIDEDETEEVAALRELVEETGYISKNITKIDMFYQDHGNSKSIITTFLAEDCKKIKEQVLDSDELVEYIEVSYDELMELFENGYITDAATTTCIRYLKEKHITEKYEKLLNINNR